MSDLQRDAEYRVAVETSDVEGLTSGDDGSFPDGAVACFFPPRQIVSDNGMTFGAPKTTARAQGVCFRAAETGSKL